MLSKLTMGFTPLLVSNSKSSARTGAFASSMGSAPSGLQKRENKSSEEGSCAYPGEFSNILRGGPSIWTGGQLAVWPETVLQCFPPPARLLTFGAPHLSELRECDMFCALVPSILSFLSEKNVYHLGGKNCWLQRRYIRDQYATILPINVRVLFRPWRGSLNTHVLGIAMRGT
jgi:hypothetical protein